MLALTCTRRQARVWLSALLAVVASAALGVSPAAAVLPGSVYIQTNAPVNNEVIVFTRAADGSLTETSRVRTGGNGDPTTPPFGFKILDSQGSVELSDSQHLVFAVNAGSGTLSSFRVVPGGSLELVETVPVGDLPVSVDSRGDLVYVLNEGDQGANNPRAGTIQGFRVAANGQLTGIPGSSRGLSVTGNSNAAAAQIGFDATGRVLTVTHRFPPAGMSDRIDTFLLGPSDAPGPAIVNGATGFAANNIAPFGFAYNANNVLLVSNALDGSISSYQLNAGTGALTFIDNEPTTQAAPCWVVISADGRFAFVTNTLSNTITRLEIAANGNLTELGQTPVPGPGAAADEALTPDGRFLHVLLPTDPTRLLGNPNPSDTSQTDTFAVSGGNLTLLNPGGTTASNLYAGVSGLTATGADATPPDTAILAGPSDGARTGTRTPTFAFTAIPVDEANPTFTCSVNGVNTPCSSPFSTFPLGDGRHTFSVAATDFGGNTDPTPATRTFTVDTRAPRPQPGCPLRGGQIVGNRRNNTLNGNARVNIIFGLQGRDILRGRGNGDCLYGGSGNDSLNGGTGRDRMFGNTGTDRLTDTSGRDVFSGGSGNDRINSRDRSRSGRRRAARDSVRCGSGRRDVAIVDRRDSVSRDCERVFRRRI